MELCLSSTKTLRLTSQNYSSISNYSHPFPLLDSTLQFNTRSRSNCPPLLSTGSRQFQSLKPISASRKSSGAVVPAEVEPDRLPADVEVTETPEPDSRVRLSVKVPDAVCEDCYKRVVKEFTKQAKVPGFRPGKVPESILVNYVGKQNVQKATIESILKRTLPHAMSSVC